MDNRNQYDTENFELLDLLNRAAALTRPGRGHHGRQHAFGAVPLLQPERQMPGRRKEAGICGREGGHGGFRGPYAPPGELRGPCGEHSEGPHRERERVLSLLSESQGISQRKLALILDIRPQSISELLGKLERDGLVQREKNQEDRRETLVSLTEQGRERADAFERAKWAAAERILAPLSMAERTALASLLQKLILHNEASEDCLEI